MQMMRLIIGDINRLVSSSSSIPKRYLDIRLGMRIYQQFWLEKIHILEIIRYGVGNDTNAPNIVSNTMYVPYLRFK